MTRPKRSVRCVVLAVVFVLSGVLSFLAEGASGQPVGRNARFIARQRDYQKRARRLMQELLKGVLQMHLKQLEENKMSKLALYTDLKEMQKRSTVLIDRHMNKAVALLSKAYDLQGAERAEVYKAAQEKMHEILRQILRERERLRLRRQLAELVERVRSLLGGQKSLLKKTLELNAERETATTRAIHAQKALDLMARRLVEVLKSAADQSGELGAMAADAGRAMQKAGITAAMTKATEQLTTNDFPEAAETQRRIIAGLEKVMATLQIDTRRSLQQAQIQVVKLLERQEKLLKAVGAKEMTDANAELWIKEQGAITEALRSIIGLVGTSEQCIRLADIGVSSSENARRAIFGKEKAQAMGEQGRVVGALAELLEELKRRIGMERDRTGGELMVLHKKLLEARDKIAAALEKHQQGAKIAGSNAAKASEIEAEVSTALKLIAKEPELTKIVVSRILTAVDAAEAAAKALSQKDSADGVKKVQAASRAIRHAVGEAREGAAWALIEALAFTSAELNRAGEVLDRAGAVSGYLFHQLKANRLSVSELKYPQSEIDRVRQIAERAAEGVALTDLDSVKGLKAHAAAAAKLAAEMGEKKKNPSAAGRLAESFRTAAAGVRKTMKVAAEKLTQTVKTELSGIVTIQEEMKKLLGTSAKPSVQQIRALGDKAFANTPSIGAALHRAADAHPEGRRDLQRSVILAEIKRENLELLIEEAQNLQQQAQYQQTTVQAIISAVAASNQGLIDAMVGHSDSLAGVGLAVESLTGGSEIVNKPIRDAAEIASLLGAGEGEDEYGQPLGQAAMPGGGTPVGTALTPTSPLETAAMIAAGAGASEEDIAEAIEDFYSDPAGGGMGMGMGEGMGGMGEGMGEGMGGMGGGMGQGMGEGMMPGFGGVGDAGGSSTGDGPATENSDRLQGAGEYMDIKDGESEAAYDAGDAARGGGKSTRRSWFTSLPDVIRGSVRSRAKTVTPKGYEELLRRYFEDQE